LVPDLLYTCIQPLAVFKYPLTTLISTDNCDITHMFCRLWAAIQLLNIRLESSDTQNVSKNQWRISRGGANPYGRYRKCYSEQQISVCLGPLSSGTLWSWV